MFLFASASRLSTRTFGSPATASAVSFAIAGSTSTATTAAARAGHERRQGARPEPTSRITSLGPDLGRLDDQIMNVQVDQEILTQPVLGRDSALGEEAPEVRLGLSDRHMERTILLFPSSFCTCLARMSTSMLTRSPGPGRCPGSSWPACGE